MLGLQRPEKKKKKARGVDREIFLMKSLNSDVGGIIIMGIEPQISMGF